MGKQSLRGGIDWKGQNKRVSRVKKTKQVCSNVCGKEAGVLPLSQNNASERYGNGEMERDLDTQKRGDAGERRTEEAMCDQGLSSSFNTASHSGSDETRLELECFRLM